MVYLKIADIVIEAKGFESEYFNCRTKEYLYDEALPDMRVEIELCENIPIPDAKVEASATFRKYCRTETGYCIYDADGDKCIAAVFADERWENVKAFLTDVTAFGGADNDVRRFNLLGEVFRYRILWMDGIAYHSSTISYKGNGVIFTASSGTGKSTHTGLWVKYYGEDTEIINDDTPVARIIDNEILLFGTPWSGKTDINKNVCVPARAIVFLSRGKENRIQKLNGLEAYRKLFAGVMIRPVYKEAMEKTLEMLDKLLSVPMYSLECNISREAVDTVKNYIFE